MRISNNTKSQVARFIVSVEDSKGERLYTFSSYDEAMSCARKGASKGIRSYFYDSETDNGRVFQR